jgi:FKBP-type peptidyl-prolyl cis-trans isomerase 2
MEVKSGDKIKVEYTGSFENGEVFDASEKHGQPLEFEAGKGMVVPGFDAAVIGMKVGEEKEVTLKPEEAYGMPNEQAIQKVPKDKFPAEAKEGMMIGVPLPNGQQMPAVIKKIDEKEVTIDMNHPMAGKTLVFKIKIVSIANDE